MSASHPASGTTVHIEIHVTQYSHNKHINGVNQKTGKVEWNGGETAGIVCTEVAEQYNDILTAQISAPR